MECRSEMPSTRGHNKHQKLQIPLIVSRSVIGFQLTFAAFGNTIDREKDDSTHKNDREETDVRYRAMADSVDAMSSISTEAEKSF
jgi:hypothetical protein